MIYRIVLLIFILSTPTVASIKSGYLGLHVTNPFVGYYPPGNTIIIGVEGGGVFNIKSFHFKTQLRYTYFYHDIYNKHLYTHELGQGKPFGSHVLTNQYHIIDWEGAIVLKRWYVGKSRFDWDGIISVSKNLLNNQTIKRYVYPDSTPIIENKLILNSSIVFGIGTSLQFNLNTNTFFLPYFKTEILLFPVETGGYIGGNWPYGRIIISLGILLNKN